ncbi:MAG: excinuclease ABC subunit A [Bacteroidetes bacterium 4572_112]|nr:MAG: excinuclease ABC subunit A [Bacteroidetes bacterium 4572_112]
MAITNFIEIKGAKVNNLKDVSVRIPRNKFVVITGLSGSGKSSLAFDTLYAEGQRRYVESLSSYARQFMGKMSKPQVDKITGISPAIAIEQKVNTNNPRSTVGTSTEIYEYVKLLFARIGKTYSPISGGIVKRHHISDVLGFINTFDERTKFIIAFPLKHKEDRTLSLQMNLYMQQGYARVFSEGEITLIQDKLESSDIDSRKAVDCYIVVDRLASKLDDTDDARIADSTQTAFYEGHGECFLFYQKEGKWEKKFFSNKFELDGEVFEEPSVDFFSFNNPYGACRKCEGHGTVIGVDDDLVIPDKNLSVYEGAIACWKGDKMGLWKDKLVMNAMKFKFPIHRPINELTDKEYKLLWTGNNYFEGIDAFFKDLEQNSYKIQFRVMLSRYRGRTVCPDCRGTRVRKETNFVKIDGKNIVDIVLMSVEDALSFFTNIKLDKHDAQIAERLIIEILNRLQVLSDVGLSYLTLNRKSATLSGGESQRINLATSLGSSLVGSLYILDEPSIGLHARDNQRLIKVLKNLRDIGNTVIVVEHDEEIMKAADYIIDIGPVAGTNGGEVVYAGEFAPMVKSADTLTAKYLRGDLEIPIPKQRRKWNQFIELTNASENNLKNVSVKFPLNTMTLVTGVSGSGKTTLVKGILYPALKKIIGGHADKTGKFGELKGDFKRITDVELIDQNPIGRSSRSNPVTYIKAYDEIRTLYATQKLAKVRGYKPGYFSFNVEGGRCEVCKGDGNVRVEMQFMADIFLPCEHCESKRFKAETLDVKYKGKSISDLLDMTVEDAYEFFAEVKGGRLESNIANKLSVLKDVGMGYVKLGQPSNTLSGGEAQRIKLASFLSKGKTKDRILFIFDEPTTGLHFHDILKLYNAMTELIRIGHSLIIIEHNQEFIKCADWIIDIGAEGGEKGGNIMFEGVPEDLAKCEASYTAEYLKV